MGAVLAPTGGARVVSMRMTDPPAIAIVQADGQTTTLPWHPAVPQAGIRALVPPASRRLRVAPLPQPFDVRARARVTLSAPSGPGVSTVSRGTGVVLRP
jgi:hypothetical protein